MYIALHYYQSLSNTKKEMTWKQQENIAYDTKIRYSWWITVAGQAFWHQVSRLSNIFFRPNFRSEFLKNSTVTCQSPASFVQKFLKNFRDIWTFAVTKRLLFRRQFWSIGIHEEFQGHLLFLTGKYSLWHKNPVFVMNYCSWASFLTSGCEIHIFRPEF